VAPRARAAPAFRRPGCLHGRGRSCTEAGGGDGCIPDTALPPGPRVARMGDAAPARLRCHDGGRHQCRHPGNTASEWSGWLLVRHDRRSTHSLVQPCARVRQQRARNLTALHRCERGDWLCWGNAEASAAAVPRAACAGALRRGHSRSSAQPRGPPRARARGRRAVTA